MSTQKDVERKNPLSQHNLPDGDEDRLAFGVIPVRSGLLLSSLPASPPLIKLYTQEPLRQLDCGPVCASGTLCRFSDHITKEFYVWRVVE